MFELASLSDDVLRQIFSHLDYCSILCIGQVCSRFTTLSSSDYVWKQAYRRQWATSECVRNMRSCSSALGQSSRLLGLSIPELSVPGNTCLDKVKSWKQAFKDRLQVARNWSKPESFVITTLHGHTDFIRCAELSYVPGGGAVLVTAASSTSMKDCSTRVWDVDSSVCRLHLEAQHAGPIWCMSYDPLSKTIATGSEDTTLQVWELERQHSAAGQCRQLEGHTAPVRCVQLEGGRLLSSSDRELRVWSLEAGECLGVMPSQRPDTCISCMQMERTFAAAASIDGIIEFWDIERCSLVRTLGDPGHAVSSLSFSLADSSLVSGYESGAVDLWDLERGARTGTLSASPQPLPGMAWRQAVYCHQAGPDSVVAGYEDRCIRVWDRRCRRVVAELAGHQEAISCLGFDSWKVVSGGWDGMVGLWDLRMAASICMLTGHSERVWAIQFDDYRILSASLDHTVRITSVPWTAATEGQHKNGSFIQSGGAASCGAHWAGVHMDMDRSRSTSATSTRTSDSGSMDDWDEFV